jgi:hypothetical protein
MSSGANQAIAGLDSIVIFIYCNLKHYCEYKSIKLMIVMLSNMVYNH